MSAPNHRLREFSARLLSHQGALVEDIEPHGIEALLPEHVSARLGGAREYVRLGFAAEIPAEAERVNLESDWLARCAELLGEDGRRAALIAPPDLATQPPRLERALERHVVLGNAAYRVGPMVPAWTRYVIWVVRYTAISDEKRAGLLLLEGNTANGSAVQYAEHSELARPSGNAGRSLLGAVLAGHIPLCERLPEGVEAPPAWTDKELGSWLARSLPERIRAELDPFTRAMQRRLERDLSRIHAYFSGLRQESFARLGKASADHARERLRIEAAEREFRTKVAELEQRYALAVSTGIAQSIEIVTPVWRVELSLMRRKGRRVVHLDWNPLTHRLDTLPCEWGHDTRDLRLVCDDRLHLVPEHGMAPCARCGKAFCRACQPRGCGRCATTDAGRRDQPA